MSVNLPRTLPLEPVPGIRIGTAAAEIRYQDRDDLVVMVCDEGTVAGAVFTQNQFKAAPVIVAQSRTGAVRGIVINSGNANAATGDRGLQDAHRSCAQLACLIGCDESDVLPFSTGVIGEFLPMDRMGRGIRQAFENAEEDGWNRAAEAILTTDTASKGLSSSIDLSGQTVCATGMVKGAGMIRPDMATLLAFVGCDAGMTAEVANSLAKDLADRSFNRLTIDGDTSTNDAFLLMATGKSGSEPVDEVGSSAYRQLLDGLTPVVRELAIRTVRDGEGATKFITVTVSGGKSEQECLEVAYTIGHSPLVKTAAFAGDPNWGRFCMAIGRSDIEDLDTSKVSLDIDDVPIARSGMVADDYDESAASNRMSEPEFTVRVNLGRGDAEAAIWTTDFSHEYVTINAEYRT